MVSNDSQGLAVNGNNGTVGGRSKPFPPGIHVPSLTFFKDDKRDEIDWDVQSRHIEFLVSSGLHGIVIAGTNGEAATLTAAEKKQLVQTTREIARSQGRPDLPITLGCSGGCTRDVCDQTVDAKEAGADFVLVLVPSYFHFAMDQAAIIAFFEELADNSPLPVLIYSFPGVTSGLDINSEMLEVLGKHKNIIGVKLTCGGIAKVTRAAATFSPSEFAVLAGQSDWLIPAMAVGSVGCITGIANLYPKTCIRIFDLQRKSQFEEATSLQKELAKMEWGFAKGGINGTKWVVSKLRGYPETSSHCRRPYPQFSSEEKRAWIMGVVEPLAATEKKISLKG
ncbi:hypothetical protein PMZ80_004525 [Knufia obscura]|uniref:Uncharacterized protein n=1 Tax=Knufia obscura TaxID=1635080 RepID=A0ABR0RSB9_9EURO|nr:hypothetical protein PMZ80_004525 [Knufia obscura]